MIFMDVFVLSFVFIGPFFFALLFLRSSRNDGENVLGSAYVSEWGVLFLFAGYAFPSIFAFVCGALCVVLLLAAYIFGPSRERKIVLSGAIWGAVVYVFVVLCCIVGGDLQIKHKRKAGRIYCGRRLFFMRCSSFVLR